MTDSLAALTPSPFRRLSGGPHIGAGIVLLAFFAGGADMAHASTEAGVSSGTFVQTLLGLLLVVALIAGLAWYARKLSIGQAFGKNLMRVVGGVALGPRERIVLVEIGDEWLVIGLVPGQIRTLHKCPKGELPVQAGGDNLPFAAWFKQMTEKRNKNA